MTKQKSKQKTRVPSSLGPAALMTQPQSMKTRAYVYGVDKLNGYDAWALVKACAAGNMPKVQTLLDKDQRLVNAQLCYQFPIHFAVRDGNAKLVQLLLDHGADAGQSRFTYNAWHRLLQIARDREHHDVEALLERALKKQFNYSRDFEELQQAIISRNARRVGALLRRQPNLTQASDSLGSNALHWSVITRQLDLIERFVELGTPIDATRADGQTPVLLATNGAMDYWYRETRGKSHPALRNTWVIVGSLLALGAKYSISVAAAAGDQHRVEQLLRKDNGLAKRLDSARLSPLTYASREGHTHIVRLLLEHGADPNIPEEGAPDGRALFEACMWNRLETADLLLKHGANANAGLDSCGCCLTVCEVYHGKRAKPLQQLLREHGAYTPPYAMSSKQLKQALRDAHEVTRHEEFLGNAMAKADPELLNLYLAFDPSLPKNMCHWGGITHPQSPALVRQLLAHGLDPHNRDWTGKTYLHGCAENLNRSVAAVFLAAGADINARDIEFNETPLATALRCEPWCEEEDRPKLAERRRQMVEFLLKHGAASNLPDDPPWATPLVLARKRGFTEIEEILIKHGAARA